MGTARPRLGGSRKHSSVFPSWPSDGFQDFIMGKHGFISPNKPSQLLGTVGTQAVCEDRGRNPAASSDFCWHCQPSLPTPPHPRLQQCRSPRPALLPQGKQWLEMATTGLCLPCCTATIPPCSASAWKIPPGCPAGDPQVMRFYSLSDFITPTSGRSQKRPDLCACTELPQFWQKSKHHQK